MSLITGNHGDRVRELTIHFKDFADYQSMKESYFGEYVGLNIDFRMIVCLAIIRLDTAIHYAQPIASDGTVLIPPLWKKNFKGKGSKNYGETQNY